MLYEIIRPICGYATCEIDADSEDELLEKINKLSLDDYNYPGSDDLEIDQEFESIEIYDVANNKQVLYDGTWLNK